MANYTGIKKIKIGDNTFELADTDEKLKTVALTSGTTYYPILAIGANAAANRQIDSTLGGLTYTSTAGTTSGLGNATLMLGNKIASGTANNEYGRLALAGTNTQVTYLTADTTSGMHTISLPDENGKLLVGELGYTTSGNNRAVLRDSNGKLYVTQKDDNSDTKNTAGSTDSSSKLFLIGATSQAANPQTYSHDTAYVGTDGCLYSGGSKVLTAHNTYTISNSGSGNAVTGISLSGTTLTVTKGSTFITRASTFTGATSSAAGTAGTIPAPAAGDTQKVVFGDGNWWNLGLQSYYDTDNNSIIQLYRTRSVSGGGVTSDELGSFTLGGAITACGNSSGDQSLTTSAATLPMTTFRAGKGTDFTVTNNGIKCEKDGWVIVSARVYFTTGFTQFDTVHVVITKDSTNISDTPFRIPSTYCVITSGSILQEVTAGTMFYLKVYNQTAARGAASKNVSTSLTLMYV